MNRIGPLDKFLSRGDTGTEGENPPLNLGPALAMRAIWCNFYKERKNHEISPQCSARGDSWSGRLHERMPHRATAGASGFATASGTSCSITLVLQGPQ